MVRCSVVFLCSFLIGCSSSNNPGDARIDVKAVDLLKLDSLRPDNSSADAAVTATPKKVLSGLRQIMGVTSDDKIIAQSPTATLATNTLLAIPIAGGQPETITTGGWTNESIRGKVVFFWDRGSPAAKIGKLSVWAAGATKPLATSSAVAWVNTSNDGSLVFYNDNASADASQADLYVANSDGTGAKKLVRSCFTPSGAPYAYFTPKGQILLGYCEVATASPDGGGKPDAGPAPDGGQKVQLKVALVDPATGSLSPIATLGPAAVVVAWDPSFAQLVVRDSFTSASDLWLYSTSGGAPVKIDSDVAAVAPLGTLPPMSGSTSILYRTKTNALKRAPIASPPAATPLVSSDVWSLMPHPAAGDRPFASMTTRAALSPDRRWVIVRTASIPSGTYLGPIALASTENPGTPEELNAAGAVLGGEPFSADSQLLVYDTDLKPAAVTNGWLSSVWARPVAGGTAKQVATEVWAHFFGQGQRMVFSDNFVKGTPYGTADLKWQNLALPSSKPQTLAKQADDNLFFDSTRGKLIYSISAPASEAGIYVVALP